MAVAKVFASKDILKDSISGLEIAIGTIAGPASYAAGGFAADIQTDLALGGAPDAVLVQSSNGLPCKWISGTKKIMAYGAVASNAATELADTTNISTATFTMFAFRKVT